MWFFSDLISPKKFFGFSVTLMPWLGSLFILSLSYGVIFGLIVAPADYQQGDGFRIIYVHVPSAFLSLFIYFVMASAAVVGLVFQIKLAFLVIRHSLLLGTSFTFLSIVTGSLWGKPMWGTWWIWDARLTSELILLFIYTGILLFQSASAHKKSGERAVAILILVGFVDIPIVHYSVYWWNTLHQGATLRLFSPSLIAPSMGYPLISMIFAFMLYYAIVLILRMRYELALHHHHWTFRKENARSIN